MFGIRRYQHYITLTSQSIMKSNASFHHKANPPSMLAKRWQYCIIVGTFGNTAHIRGQELALPATAGPGAHLDFIQRFTKLLYITNIHSKGSHQIGKTGKVRHSFLTLFPDQEESKMSKTDSNCPKTGQQCQKMT